MRVPIFGFPKFIFNSQRRDNATNPYIGFTGGSKTVEHSTITVISSSRLAPETKREGGIEPRGPPEGTAHSRARTRTPTHKHTHTPTPRSAHHRYWPFRFPLSSREPNRSEDVWRSRSENSIGPITLPHRPPGPSSGRFHKWSHGDSGGLSSGKLAAAVGVIGI